MLAFWLAGHRWQEANTSFLLYVCLVPLSALWPWCDHSTQDLPVPCCYLLLFLDFTALLGLPPCCSRTDILTSVLLLLPGLLHTSKHHSTWEQCAALLVQPKPRACSLSSHCTSVEIKKTRASTTLIFILSSLPFSRCFLDDDSLCSASPLTLRSPHK